MRKHSERILALSRSYFATALMLALAIGVYFRSGKAAKL